MISFKKLTTTSNRKKAGHILQILWKIFRFFLIFGLAYIIMYPLLYMISMSFRGLVDMYDSSVTWIPKHFTLEHITRVMKAIHYPQALMVTVFISIVTSVILVIISSMTAYGLSRHKFRGREIIFVMVLFTIIVPQQFFVLTTFLNLKFFDIFGILKLGSLIVGENLSISLVDSPLAFFIPAIFGIGIRSGLYIYIFRQSFKGMPKELEEAAAIDGCGVFETFVKIVVPTAVPAFVTTFLFSFVWHWNDYQFSSIFLTNAKTLSAYLVNITGYVYELTMDVGSVYVVDTTKSILDIQSGCLVVIIPVLILYIFLQKFFTESIERTGLVE
ncbi:MAG: carbohydrate ABC transporter permease [Ruminococcaceae bacterium]|nr:carbohydrate ABC transporter permease [Oscillospiraceae bacterium]